ncbi:MAG: protein kinase [Deltaproteobacteria bacterium]|nr:protein kinase [Deltaproteobacteria bacterium]
MEPKEGGTIAERFRLERKIGAGSFATVWLARDTQADGLAVALKVLHPQGRADPLTRERFQREAEIVASLDHPAIVRALWWDLEASAPALAMELVEGETLHAEILRRAESAQPWSPREAIDLLRPLVEGLEHAHERGVVHRDLKPRNIVLDARRDGAPRVLDFGVAHVAGRDESDATTVGRLLGSLLYMAPEQLRGQAVDARADVFALGCILFELLTLSYAWARDERDQPLSIRRGPVRSTPQNNYAALLRRITGGPRPVPGALGSNLSPAVVEVLRKALAIAPQDRPASAQAMLTALEDAAPAATAVVDRPIATSKVEEPSPGMSEATLMRAIALARRTSARSLAALVAMAGLLLAGALLVASRRADRPGIPARVTQPPPAIAATPGSLADTSTRSAPIGERPQGRTKYRVPSPPSAPAKRPGEADASREATAPNRERSAASESDALGRASRLVRTIQDECQVDCADDVTAHEQYAALLRELSQLPDPSGDVGAATGLLQIRPTPLAKFRAVTRDLLKAARQANAPSGATRP